MRIRFDQINKVNDKTLLAVVAIGVLGIASLLLTTPKPKLIATVSSHPSTLTGQVKSASTGDSTDDGTTVVTTTTTTPASSSTDKAAQASTSGNTLPITSAATPSSPADPTAGCEVNGRVVVPQGGDSCSYTLSTLDGSSVQWYLPALYSYANGGAVEKPLAPVYIVIESQSQSDVASSQPFTAASITFHYASLTSASLGDYVDGSGGLNFSQIGPDGQPLWLSNQPQLTVVAQ